MADEDVERGGGDGERLSIDDMMLKWVGEFGPAQWLQFSLSSLAWALEALHTVVMVFADREAVSSASASTVPTFGMDIFKLGLVQAAFFVGALLGAHFFGNLADSRLGRKLSLCISVGLSGVLGFLTAFAGNFWVYLGLRCLTGATSTGGIGLVAFVLATETIGPKQRGPVGMSTLYFFSLGSMALTGIAKVTSNSWRLLYALSSLPSLVYLVVVVPFIEESPRWLLVQGRRDEAMVVLRRFATKNGRSIPTSVTVSCDSDDEEEGRGGAEGSLADVMKNPMLRMRLLLMTFIWFCAAVVYYGVTLNVANLSFDLYTSVLLNAVMEMPAFALTAFLLGKVGRRAMLLASGIISGIFCLAGAGIYAGLTSNILPKGASGAVCSAVSIFGMAGAYNLIFIYTTELFPTVVRNAALGVACGAGQVGAMVAPAIVRLAAVRPAVPFSVFAGACAVCSMLATGLPETLDQPLYETLEGIEEASKRQPLLKELEGQN